MNNEFKKTSQGEVTRYVLESASGGGTSAGGVASVSMPIGGTRKRGDNLIAQEGDKIIVPVTQKPRLGPLKPQTGGGAHRDKKKEKKQGQEKHKKPYFEDHEIQMASSELQSIAKDAVNLLSLVRKYSEQDGLDAWQQSKITKAADYLNAVLQSISGEQGMAEGGDSFQSQFDKKNAKVMKPANPVQFVKREINNNCERDGCAPGELNRNILAGIAQQSGLSLRDVLRIRNMMDPVMQQGVAAGSLNEFDSGEGGFGPFKLYKGSPHHYDHIDTFSSLDDAEEEMEFQKDMAAQEGSVDYYKIIDGTGEEVGGFDPDNAYDNMRRGSKIQHRKPGEQGMAEGSAHGYNVVRYYEKTSNLKKLTNWLCKEAGLEKNAPVYFDDVDLVYGDKTIVPGALVNPKLKFNDLLTALVRATGGQGKQNVDGVYREQDMAEAPIEMDPAEPMNPMIHGHQGANPAKLQYRMMRAAAQLKDLAQRAEQGSAIGWETIARQFDELAMNVEQIKHALEELAAKRKKGGIGSRGIDPNIGEDHSSVTGGRGQGGYDTYSNTRHGRGVAEVSDATKDSYKEKATQQVKDLKPHAKKGEYKDIAKNMIARREKGLARVSEDEYMMELAGKLAEKISANAPTDVWVKDFQKANPNKYHQFKNKTPAKKAQMAVAASYAAKNPSKKK